MRALSPVEVAGNIDWRRRRVRDGLLIAMLWSLAVFAALVFHVPPKLFNFALAHADSGVDNILFLLATAGMALLVYVDRRRADLVAQIEAHRVAELQIRRFDSLTGLANREFFGERLDETLRHAATYDVPTAVLMLTLDGFKAINDVHGQRIGDQILIEFVARARSVLHRGMYMARVEGDEFAIVVPDVERDIPANVAYRLLGALAEPIHVDGLAVALAASIGMAQDKEIAREQLIRQADWALRRAKAEGRSRVRSFEPEMDKHIKRRALIEREFREAIAAAAVTIDYLQLVRLGTGEIIGFEALARWTSPSLGTVPANEFIAAAEECGLIDDLSDQLLRAACTEAAQWPPDLTLSFNLSPVQLRDPGLKSRILAILGDTGVDPRRLELDIKESALLSDGEAVQSMIAALRDAGMRVALDDFGMGYASLSQLLTIQVDKIKIDRVFVERLGKDPQSDVIVRTTIGLAKGLGLATIAEGVQTAEQLAILRAEGCMQGQGFLFGLTVSAGEIHTMLDHVHSAVFR
jgi:diguanylate cyclase (GGDEF)-like protein